MRALAAYDCYRERAAQTRTLRAALQRDIDAIAGLRCVPSGANFLMIVSERLPAATLLARCREHSVFLRDCDSTGSHCNGRYVRTAVRDSAAAARIAAALRAAAG